MAQGGMYTSEYLKDVKKKSIDELKQANITRIGKMRVEWNKKLDQLKAKHQIQEIQGEELSNYKTKLSALSVEKLKAITGEGLSRNQIYAIGAELRSRDSKLADHFMNVVEASNYFELYKNNFDYKRLKKDETMLNIMEKDENNYYDIGEDSIQDLKQIVHFQDILND